MTVPLVDEKDLYKVQKLTLKEKQLPGKLENGSKTERTVFMKDVIGHEDIKYKLTKMLVDYFRPEVRIALKESRLPIPKGAIIYGPPGTGKTLLSKACVNEFVRNNPGLRFEFIKATDLLSSNQKKTVETIRNFFGDIKIANNHTDQETVLVIDEFDALAGSRRSKSVITQKKVECLLEEDLGGEGVFIVAPTNKPHNIDPAILSRFSGNILYAGPPNEPDRLQLLEFYTKNLKIDDRHCLIKLARRTEYWTGRDISLLASELMIEQVVKGITLDYDSIEYYLKHNFKVHNEGLKEIAKYKRWYDSLENGFK